MVLVKSETQHRSRLASLYVGDLSPDVTEKDLIDKFSVIVPGVSVVLCRNSLTGKSLCYAFVNFDSPSSASNAMACLNNTDLKGKAMRIMWSQRDLLYRRTGFGNLYSSTISSCLERPSSKLYEENGDIKGFAFPQFYTELSAILGLQFAGIRPKNYFVKFGIALCKEVISKIYTTPKDARLPKTYKYKVPPTNPHLVLKPKRPQPQHNPDYWKRNLSTRSHHSTLAAETVLSQEIRKQYILNKLRAIYDFQ